MATHDMARGSAKAWVRFNGTSTVAINDSENVSSITDHGTGDYTVNFSQNFNAADYCFAGMCRQSANNVIVTSRFDTASAIGSHRIRTMNLTANQLDCEEIGVAYFGNLA